LATCRRGGDHGLRTPRFLNALDRCLDLPACPTAPIRVHDENARLATRLFAGERDQPALEGDGERRLVGAVVDAPARVLEM
jgi:hypothetical protein